MAGLVLDEHGDMYGTTSLNGPNFQGTVFVLHWQPSEGRWQYSIVTAFQKGSTAAHPQSALQIRPGRILFGTSVSGYGNTDYGAVYQIAP
jgi:hypothetical protein